MPYLFDTTEPVITYFENNKDKLIGRGGKDALFGVYRDTFPEQAKTTGVSAFSEVAESSEYENIMLVGLRINVRAPKKVNAYTLALNVDKLLNMMVRKMITDTIELVLCKRNSGPSWLEGEDGLHYYTSLYDSTMRKTDG